jgi:hypothetical protein
VPDPAPRSTRRPRPTGSRRQNLSKRGTDGAKPPPTRSKRASATQKEILAAARVVFGRMGYGGTRLEDIATEAQISRTTLYHYYSSREDIFIELDGRRPWPPIGSSKWLERSRRSGRQTISLS